MEGEVRRIHIIYFLSRKGRIEHPHLVRVHHFSPNGVRLHDVKRWLAELRGKDMPESFAWSYKRRYRTGYVWQDLVDEDLITPISDNEYVLKGSEIPSNNNAISTDFNAEKRVNMQKDIEKEEISVYQNISTLEDIQHHQQTTISISPKTSPIFSPEASSKENSINLDEEKLLETNKNQDITKDPDVNSSEIKSSSFNSDRFYEKDQKKKRKNKMGKPVKSSGAASRKPKTSFNMVKNIFNCRAVETKDSALVKMNSTNGKNIVRDENYENSSESINSAEISKEDNLGGSDRVLLNSWKQQNCPSARRSHDGVKRSNSARSRSKSPKPHRPINGPNCSQCGKIFKPEKMHKHMRSCSGRRLFAKGSGSIGAAASSDHDLSSRSMDCSTSQELLSGYYLNYPDKKK